MRKPLLLTALALAATLGASGQPRYDHDRMSTEHLDRGVVAIRQADGTVFVTWRTLRSDRRGEPFDVYRDGQRLNSEPLRRGGTWLVDSLPPASGDATYEVRGGAVGGTFTLRAGAPVGYLPIALDKPEGGQVPVMAGQQRRQQPPQGRPGRRQQPWRDNGRYTYSANDATVADVDGDGQLEIILKWEPSNAHDNSHDGYTGPTLLDCYKVDWAAGPQVGASQIANRKSVNSRLLWRIDLGRNIRSGAHYTPFIVYDLDGDGRAELLVRTADGTRDGVGHVLGDSLADHRNGAGRVLSGTEYVTVFDGLTGRALDSQPYRPQRGDVRAWGDDRGNRSERYLAAVGYLGNEQQGRQLPSALFCRGYYTRTVIAAWDWDGQHLRERWVFDTDEPRWHAYAGQGNHNLRVADVDGDGLDELTYGSMAVDHDGQGLYNTGMGHGDALHLMAFDPTTDRLQVWDCHENRRDGSDFRDAATGHVLFRIPSTDDVGRAMAADIDPTTPGVEMWSSDSHGLRNIRGQVVAQPRLSINFGIWWDGDLLRELLDRATVTKYNWETRQTDVVQQLDGCQFNNGTKSNPCLQADLLGDWREEVLGRNDESTELRLYVSTIPTPYRIDCLLQDIPYRLSVAYQNVGYNQPPEPAFYLGPDRTDYLK